jgi:hypothetical protein
MWLALVHGLAARAESADFCLSHYGTLGLAADEEALYADVLGNLKKLPKRDSAGTHELNLRLIKNGIGPPKPRAVPGRKAFLPEQERSDLFQRAMDLPASRDSLCGKYRDSARLGFCFGRAMAVHLLALNSGLQKESIRKIWLVGDLNFGGHWWKFHVATAVRGEDGKWYVLDTVFNRLLPIDDWYREFRAAHDPSGTARLISTEPSRFYVNKSEKYAVKNLGREAFNGFFDDLLEQVRRAVKAGR